MTTHEALLAICRRLPTDYQDYGGLVERWQDPDVAYPDCSCGCRWAEWLKQPLGSDWCVCTNPNSSRAGLLTFEHMAGYHCFEEQAYPVVILTGVPDTLLAGLPAKDQAAIQSAVGGRVSHTGDDDQGLMQLEFRHEGDIHTIWVEPVWTSTRTA